MDKLFKHGKCMNYVLSAKTRIISSKDCNLCPTRFCQLIQQPDNNILGMPNNVFIFGDFTDGVYLKSVIIGTFTCSNNFKKNNITLFYTRFYTFLIR